MEDLLYKGHFKGLDIAFTYTVATRAVNKGVVLHDCDPAAAHILGRAITGALLSAALQPEGQRVNLCWKYKGQLTTVVVDAGQDGTVRGFIHPAQLSEASDDHDALYGEIGEFQLVVTEAGKIISSGTTPIPLHDVVKDLAYYFCLSDQVETGMSAMIGFQPDPKNPVQLCHGWMIQALPNCDLERFDRIRQRMDADGFRNLLCHGSDADGYFEDIAASLVGDESGYEGLHLEACPVPRFHCPCSREKMGTVLLSLPINDRMEMVKKNEPVGVRCHFCNTRYELTIPECINAWNKKPLDTPAAEAKRGRRL